LKDLGEHPGGGGKIQVLDGKYGPYVSWNKVNATVPKGTEPANLSLDEAIRLLQERAAKGGGKKPARGAKAAAPKAKTAPKAKKAEGDTEPKLAKAKAPAAKKPAKKAAPKAKKSSAKADAEG
jgi:DNA topoisomerase I